MVERVMAKASPEMGTLEESGLTKVLTRAYRFGNTMLKLGIFDANGEIINDLFHFMLEKELKRRILRSSDES
jgi:hypothetical protein